MDQLTFLSAEPPANPSALQDAEQAWRTTVETWPSNLSALLAEHAPDGWLGRTSPAFLAPTEAKTSDASSPDLLGGTSQCPETDGKAAVSFPPDLRMAPTDWHTECLTLNTSEWPSDGVACSLSDTLETGDVPPRFFLSVKACDGILRRAKQAGNEIPALLRRCLKAVVDGLKPSQTDSKSAEQSATELTTEAD